MKLFLILPYINILLEAKHCPASSDVRELITRPPPVCQSETIFKLFDENFKSESPECTCCFSCIVGHIDQGCVRCKDFMDTFFNQSTRPKVSRSVSARLREAMEEIFTAMEIETLLVEQEFELSTGSLIRDFIKNCDEIRAVQDIVDMWHIEYSVAESLYLLFNEVVFGKLNFDSDENLESDESESDVSDVSTEEEGEYQ